MSSLLNRVTRTRRAHDRLTKEASALGVDLASLSLSEQYTLAMELFPPPTKIASADFVRQSWESMGEAVAHTVQGVASEKQASPAERYLSNMSAGAALGGTLGSVTGGALSDDPALGATAGALLGAGAGGHLGALRARIADTAEINEPGVIARKWRAFKKIITNPIQLALASGLGVGGAIGLGYKHLDNVSTNKMLMDKIVSMGQKAVP